MTNDTRKKVMLLITKSNWGGAQRYVYDIATNLSPMSFDVVVALGGDGPLVDKLKAANITVIGIPGLQRDISLYKELRSAFAIAQIIRKEDPDILHVNSSKAGFIGAVLGRILGVPKVIFTAHGWAFNEDRGAFSRFLMGFFHWMTILASHKTITVSHALKTQMTWPGTQKKMHTIYNGGHMPVFLSRQEAKVRLCARFPYLAEYTDDYWSVTIGELHKTKQHDVAIRAIAELVHNDMNIRHIIISEGEERQSLETLIHDLHLTQHVFLLGHLDQAAVYLPAFDVFILASRSEALAYVILEAAQATLPIVASRVGGIPEIVTDGAEATLVPSGDAQAIAAAVTHYYKNPDYAHRHAEAAHSKSQTFSLQTMVSVTQKMYRE